MKKNQVFCLVLAASLSVSSTTVFAADFLSAPEVKALVTGKTANGEHLKKGHKYKVFFNADGTYVQTRTDGSRFLGKWRIKRNGAHCIQPNHKNKEFCRRMRKEGNGTYIKVKKKGFNSIDVVKLWNFVDGNQVK